MSYQETPQFLLELPLVGLERDTAMAQHLLSDLVSYFTIDEINIDNLVFKLFYKVSTVLCMLGASIGVAQAYFGKPISCDFGDDLYNDYCWMHGGSYFPQEYQEERRMTGRRRRMGS